MRVLIPILVVALVLVTVLAARRGGGLVRGVADDMLVSPARPDIAVRVDPALRLADARRADLSPAVQGSLQPGASAEIWYALYEKQPDANPEGKNGGKNGLQSAASLVDEGEIIPVASPSFAEASTVRLVSLLAVTESPYTWPPASEAEAAPGQTIIRSTKLTLDGFSGTAASFLLPKVDDPWADASEVPGAVQYADEKEDPWQEGSLVRRFTFLLFQQRAKLIVEYREPNPVRHGTASLPLADDLPRLAAFEQRAEAAFHLLSDKNGQIPRPQKQLAYPPAGVGRKVLAAFIGDVWRAGGN